MPPESVIVLGGGAIALELAHYYDGIGKKVTVIQRSEHLLTGMDHDVADELETALKDRGLEVFCGTKILKVDVLTDGVKRVTFEHKGQTVEVAGEEILVALGRNATSDKLALDKAGVALNKDKVKVEASMQTTAPNIFAAGDVCGPYEIVHIAIEQGEKAAENAMMYLRGCDPTEYQLMDYRLKLYGIFTEPQVATVGITEIEAAREGRESSCRNVSFQ